MKDSNKLSKTEKLDLIKETLLSLVNLKTDIRVESTFEELLKYDNISPMEMCAYANSLKEIKIVNSEDIKGLVSGTVGYYQAELNKIVLCEDRIDSVQELLYIFLHEFAHHINKERGVDEKDYNFVSENNGYLLEEIQADTTAKALSVVLNSIESKIKINIEKIDHRIKRFFSNYKRNMERRKRDKMRYTTVWSTVSMSDLYSSNNSIFECPSNSSYALAC